jgi:hypothetical protein
MAASSGFSFDQVRAQLRVRGLQARSGPDGTLTLVPRLAGTTRSDLLTTWGIDDHGHLYCDLTQSLDGPGSFDLLDAIATTTPCLPGNETHVAGLIAEQMQTTIARLARVHPVPSPAMALSA